MQKMLEVSDGRGNQSRHIVYTHTGANMVDPGELSTGRRGKRLCGGQEGGGVLFFLEHLKWQCVRVGEQNKIFPSRRQSLRYRRYPH